MRRNPNNPDLPIVAQTSKSAVPQVSKPAGRRAGMPTWKSAAQQVWKPAPRMNGGFTLVEMLIVIIIVSIMSVAIVAEMHGTFQDELLRSTSRELAGAFNLASSRAISINRPHRIRIDRVAHRFLLERSSRGGKDFYPAKDTPGNSGTLDPRITIHVLEPGLDAPDDAGQEPSGNAGDQVEIPSFPSQDAVTFYPDGTADERLIELTDRDGFRLAMRINPITSRVQVKAMEHP